ncbi:MAG: hypothetical protein COB98_03850 [Flavobacteriaceae bacterium]|nr:MAG: hypothetical protein COB98_03850 [Flavobacteriaceae bacterium]
MKTRKLLLVLVTFLMVNGLLAQENTVWFDSNWKTTVEGSAMYYRPNPEKTPNGYWLVDYYTSGVMQMEGLSRALENDIFEGQIKWYFENGKIHQTIFYSEGVLNGSRKIYYRSGKLNNERYYVMGKLKGDYVEFYESGAKKKEGSYKNGEKSGKWHVFYEDGEVKVTGMYEKGQKVGEWKQFYYDGSYE